MPVTLMPGAARNVSVTQSLSSPGVSVTPVPSRSTRTLRRLRSSVARRGTRSGGEPSTNMFSGPSTLETTASPSRRDRHADAALLEAPGFPPRGVEQERALRAEQVGHAHRAQLRAIEPVGWKRDGHAEHGAPDLVLAENCPERLGSPEELQLRLVERDAVPSQPEEPLHAPDARGREQREVGAPIAVEEVEDVVARRVRAGAERRPCHRRHGGERGPQPLVAPVGRELLEVGQQAFRHEAVCERRILTVEAHDDQPRNPGLRRLLARQHPPERAERPDEERRDDDEDRGEEDEERREQGETGPGADIGVGRDGHQQHCEREEAAAPMPGSHV
jgi:hypothetical protein